MNYGDSSEEDDYSSKNNKKQPPVEEKKPEPKKPSPPIQNSYKPQPQPVETKKKIQNDFLYGGTTNNNDDDDDFDFVKLSGAKEDSKQKDNVPLTSQTSTNSQSSRPQTGQTGNSRAELMARQKQKIAESKNIDGDLITQNTFLRQTGDDIDYTKLSNIVGQSNMIYEPGKKTTTNKSNLPQLEGGNKIISYAPEVHNPSTYENRQPENNFKAYEHTSNQEEVKTNDDKQDSSEEDQEPTSDQLKQAQQEEQDEETIGAQVVSLPQQNEKKTQPQNQQQLTQEQSQQQN